MERYFMDRKTQYQKNLTLPYKFSTVSVTISTGFFNITGLMKSGFKMYVEDQKSNIKIVFKNRLLMLVGSGM